MTRTVRNERGQTAAEYLGLVVVVAVIVFVLGAKTAIGNELKGDISHAICVVAHGGDPESSCKAPAPAQGAPGSTGPQGPAIGTGPGIVPGIPWTGSISYTQRDNPEDGPYLEASVSKERSACRPDEDGNYTTTLSVTGTIRAGASYGVGGGKSKSGKTLPSASADAYVGNDVSYGITTDNQRADDIVNHKTAPPNPIDPRTIPAGTALTLDKSSYAGLDLSASYRGVQSTLGYEKGHTVSSAIQRLDATHVQVLVGDSDYVKQAVELGLGTDDFNVSFGHDDTFTDGKAKAVDIDISTPAGLAAYGQFVKTGKLPTSGPAISNAQSTQTSDVSGSGHLGAKVGPVDVQFGGGDFRNTVTTTKQDGARRGALTTTQYSQAGDYSVTRQTVRSEDGFPGTSTNTIRLQNANQLDVNAANTLGIKNARKGDDISFQLSDAQLNQIKDTAYKQLKAEYERDERKPVSDKTLQWLIDHGDATSEDTFRLMLAKAKTPEDVLNALYLGGRQAGGFLVYLDRFNTASENLGVGPGLTGFTGKAEPNHC